MNKYIITLLLLLLSVSTRSQTLYFPPPGNNSTWDTLSPSSLGWCLDEIDSLYNFLDNENSKAFVLLKDGKIVLERYFDSFTRDSIWYWASAGKSLTAFLIGQAQEQGSLSIQDPVSDHLGTGWTNCTPQQELNITIRNQLTMTTGLDDGIADNDCTDDTCLIYLADAGTRWAYHNAPYTLLEDVLTSATGLSYNTFTQNNVRSRTGMSGFWTSVGYNNVYFSNARSMARYGLLIQSRGVWNGDTLLHDTAYFRQMVNTSQNLNLSYGYLWWLNGKPSYMVPTSQLIIPGSYAPNAPGDMFSALGKNGQIISISPSNGIVFVRMGEEPNSPASDIATIFCDQIWQRLDRIMCSQTSLNARTSTDIIVYPQPANKRLFVSGIAENSKFTVYDRIGSKRISGTVDELDVSQLENGFFILEIESEKGFFFKKIHVLH